MNENGIVKKEFFITAIAIIIVGLATVIVGHTMDQPAVGVLGGGLLGFSIVLLVRLIIAKRKPSFAKQIDTETKDERIKQIYIYSGNTSFWIVMFILIAFSIITRTDNIVLLMSPAIFLIVYVVSVLYYRRKY